jgi:hypothetical protein
MRSGASAANAAMVIACPPMALGLPIVAPAELGTLSPWQPRGKRSFTYRVAKSYGHTPQPTRLVLRPDLHALRAAADAAVVDEDAVKARARAATLPSDVAAASFLL